MEGSKGDDHCCLSMNLCSFENSRVRTKATADPIGIHNTSGSRLSLSIERRSQIVVRTERRKFEASTHVLVPPRAPNLIEIDGDEARMAPPGFLIANRLGFGQD